MHEDTRLILRRDGLRRLVLLLPVHVRTHVRRMVPLRKRHLYEHNAFSDRLGCNEYMPCATPFFRESERTRADRLGAGFLDLIDSFNCTKGRIRADYEQVLPSANRLVADKNGHRAVAGASCDFSTSHVVDPIQ